MTIHLKKMIEELTEEKKIHLSDSVGWPKIRSIEREAQTGKLSASEIITALKREERLRLGLSSKDFSALEKKIDREL